MDEKTWDNLIKAVEYEMKMLDSWCDQLGLIHVDPRTKSDPNYFWRIVVDVIKTYSSEWGISKSNQQAALAECLGREMTMAYYYLNQPEKHPLPSIPFEYFQTALKYQYGDTLDANQQLQARTGEFFLNRLRWFFEIKCDQFGDLKPPLSKKKKTPKPNKSDISITPLTPIFDAIALSMEDTVIELEEGTLLVWYNRKSLFNLNDQDFEFFFKLLFFF